MSESSYKIALIGTGNVAWHLAKSFENAGHKITDVFNRDIKKAKEFTKHLYSASPTNSLNLTYSQADIYILAISDDSIESIAQQLELPDNAIIAHTSGTISLDRLGYAHTPHTGVFYPLQTFSKNKSIEMETVPICIEGSDSLTTNTLKTLAASISKNVQLVDSKKRKSIHLAAVFACNFTNHMLTLSKSIINEQELDFKLLHPLIVETLNKSLQIGPENAQTGPAKRNDLETLDQQYKALEKAPSTAELYRLVSQHIIDYYSE